MRHKILGHLPLLRYSGVVNGLNFFGPAMTSDFIWKIAETLATRVLLIGIGLVASVMIARMLGPEGRGLYAVASSVGMLGVQFGNLGLHASNTYHAARDQRLLPALLGNTLIVSFVFGSFIAAMIWAVLSQWPHLAAVHGVLLASTLVYIPLGLGYVLLQNLFLGVQKIHAFNMVELVNRMLAVLLMGFLIISGTVSVEKVFGTALVALGVCLALMIWWIRGSLYSFPSPRLEILRITIRYGIKVYLTDLFSFFALRANLLIIQYMLGAEDVGYYSIAINLADVIYMYPMVVGTLLFPKLSVLDGDKEKWELTKKMTFAVALQMAVVCLGFAIFGKWLILTLYGKWFIPSIPLFHLSLISIYCLSIQGILVKYMASQGYPSTIMWIWLFTMIIGLPLNVLLISVAGLLGSMYASIATHGILMILIIYFSLKHHRKRASM